MLIPLFPSPPIFNSLTVLSILFVRYAAFISTQFLIIFTDNNLVCYFSSNYYNNLYALNFAFIHSPHSSKSNLSNVNWTIAFSYFNLSVTFFALRIKFRLLNTTCKAPLDLALAHLTSLVPYQSPQSSLCYDHTFLLAVSHVLFVISRYLHMNFLS